MKKLIFVLLILLLLTGCATQQSTIKQTQDSNQQDNSQSTGPDLETSQDVFTELDDSLNYIE